MTSAQLLRLGGQIGVVGAALILASQVIGPFVSTEPTTITTTVTGVPFLVFALLKLVGFVFLMLGLVSLYARQSAATGRLGFIGFLTTFAGTALVTGDWWFEAFAFPWLAQAAPDLVATPVGGTLLLGGAVGFITFTVGWLIFAAATFRARVFPRWMAVLLMAGALLAIKQGFPPFGALLAIAVGVMGVALLRLDRMAGGTGVSSGGGFSCSSAVRSERHQQDDERYRLHGRDTDHQGGDGLLVEGSGGHATK